MSTRTIRTMGVWLQRLFLLLVFAAPQISAADEERLDYDLVNGDYILYYYSHTTPQVLQRIVIVPTTKIDPEVSSRFVGTDRESIRYHYKLKNRANSRQPLVGFRYEVERVNPDSQRSPDGWEGVVLFDPDMGGQYRVNWSYSNLSNDGTAGLQPGKSASGFAIESNALPGIILAKLNGDAPLQMGFPDEGPDPDSKVGKQLRSIDEFVRRQTVVPKIPNPAPFNAVTVLTGLQQHLNTDLVSMKLAEPVLASQLDRALGAALDAAKIGNNVAARENLKQFRKLLKQEHEDVDHEDEKDFDKDDERKESRGKTGAIDRIAARVLDFDAKYVMKKLEKKD